MAQLFFCAEPRWVTSGGTEEFIPASTFAVEGDPLLAAHPDAFEPVVVAGHGDFDVTTATVQVVGSQHEAEFGYERVTMTRACTKAPAPLVG